MPTKKGNVVLFGITGRNSFIQSIDHNHLKELLKRVKESCRALDNLSKRIGAEYRKIIVSSQVAKAVEQLSVPYHKKLDVYKKRVGELLA